MQNQQNKSNKSPEEALQDLRIEIDKIDNDLILLLEKRMNIVAKVGELKRDNKENFFIRSAREADMIRDLVAKSDGSFSKIMIVEIWRKIISAANIFEQGLKIVLHNPKNIADYNCLVNSYYSDAIPVETLTSASDIIAKIENSEVQIGIFALGENENWWIDLAKSNKGIKIYAKIPFVKIFNQNNKHELVALAIKDSERSQADNSLIYVELGSETSEGELISALKNSGIVGKILNSVKRQYLLEFEGFLDENDDRIQSLLNSNLKPNLKILGHYPVPMELK